MDERDREGGRTEKRVERGEKKMREVLMEAPGETMNTKGLRVTKLFIQKHLCLSFTIVPLIGRKEGSLL